MITRDRDAVYMYSSIVSIFMRKRLIIQLTWEKDDTLKIMKKTKSLNCRRVEVRGWSGGGEAL